jgi:hypothetical protein
MGMQEHAVAWMRRIDAPSPGEKSRRKMDEEAVQEDDFATAIGLAQVSLNATQIIRGFTCGLLLETSTAKDTHESRGDDSSARHGSIEMHNGKISDTRTVSIAVRIIFTVLATELCLTKIQSGCTMDAILEHEGCASLKMFSN